MDKKLLQVQLPAPGESVKEVMVSRFFVENGGFVKKDGVICEIESDKATMEVISPQAGKVTIKIEAGKTYPVGTVAAEVDTADAPPVTATTAAPVAAPTPPKKEEIKPASKQEEIKPASKQEEIKPASKHEGKAVRQGMEEFLEVKEKPSNTHVPTTQPALEGEKREPMSLIRKTIAKRLVDVKNETAMLTTFNEVDMSNVMRLRKEFQEAFTKKFGIKLGFMGFFTKAVQRALEIYPKVNAKIDKDMIVYPNGIHVGIAVSTERGLVVPVIRHVEKLSLAEVELAIAQMAAKGRDGKLTIKDFEGGSFTITNGGVFGSLLSTPILNPPQSGILGMHATMDRPVAIQGKVEIRPMMYIALSYDHRIIDGKEAVGFLVEVKRWIESPEIGVLGL
ncbi:MAG: 2-oxoglutarate dehydrogenase complex dihydrolipoyllysine-residue succinyltransferase [Chlamydiia bacterium]